MSDSQRGPSIESENQRRPLPQVLALLQDPVLIGVIGALLWCILMVAAVYLFRRHSRTGHLIPRHSKGKGEPCIIFILIKQKKTKQNIVFSICFSLFFSSGLHRLANEDLVIKHR